MDNSTSSRTSGKGKSALDKKPLGEIFGNKAVSTKHTQLTMFSSHYKRK
jgi:hypothetical protein